MTSWAPRLGPRFRGNDVVGFLGGRLRLCIAALVATAYPAVACADEGDVAFGLSAGARYPGGARAELFVRRGFTDWVSVRLEAGVDIDDSGGEVLAALGVVSALDVLSFVPELYWGIGMGAGRGKAKFRVMTRVGVRWFVAMDWSLGLHLGGEFATPNTWYGTSSVGVWWHLQ